MAGSNAGKKRNRLPAGATAWSKQLTLDSRYGAAIEEAAALSGSLAPSLYVQLLLGQLVERDADGKLVLPVMNPAERVAKENRTRAA